MPMQERKIQGFKAQPIRFILSVAAFVCLVGLAYVACLSPQPLQATPEQDQQSVSSIRLGLPAFAFGTEGSSPATKAMPSQTLQQPVFGQPAAMPGSSTAIQITPGAPKQTGGIVISPRGTNSSKSGSRSYDRQSSFYLASQQSEDSPSKEKPAKADEFWKSIVNGQATRLNDSNEPESKSVQPPSKMRLPDAPALGSQPAGPNSIGDALTIPNAALKKSVPAVPAQPMPIPQNGRPNQALTPQLMTPQLMTPQSGQSPSTLPPPPPTVIGDSPASTSGFGGQSSGHSYDSAPLPLLDDSNSQSMPPLGAHSIPSGQPIMSPTTSGHSFHQSQPGMSGFRATVEKDATDWISPYAQRADQSIIEEASDIVPALDAMPAGFRPWWDNIVRQAVNPRAATMQVNVSNLIQDALLYSPQVVAIQAEPEVKYRIITQEAARFDWTAFLESTYNDLNDPVGNELTTGNGEDRLLTRQWQFSSGVRRRNEVGGEFQVTQDFGHENQNSRFFIPNNQASSRLELSYRQPLLDGAGRAFNQSEIVLARIEANSSEDEVVDALQDHLIQVTTAYWTLYRSRSEFFQRQKLLISAQDVLTRLEGRSAVDTIPRQILRARAAVARAKTGIRRTLARVEDAEAQLRLLVNSPGMLNGGPTELLPFEPPENTTESADLRSVLQTALFNRADISGAIRQMRAAGVRLGVSQQELLPRLDLLVSGYVADLSGNSDLGNALEGQYVDNRPGYTVGLEFEMPIGNRAARARNEQRQWELKRAINVFRATVEKSLTDVEIGRREVETSHAEMTSRFHSMMAASQESNYLKDRFRVLPEAEDSATLLLEDLLDSFERLADEESAFVRAQVDHALSLIDLKKQMGTLLRSRHDRPAIDSAHQQWVQDRLQTHAPAGPTDGPSDGRGEFSGRGGFSGRSGISDPQPKSVNHDRAATVSEPRKQAAFRSGNILDSSSSVTPLSSSEIMRLKAESTSKSNIQQAAAKRYKDLYVPKGEPIPAHQTTWKRSPLNQ